MTRNILERYNSLLQRRADPDTKLVKLAKSMVEAKVRNDSVDPFDYLLECMEALEPAATKKTLGEADRVFNQIEEPLRELGYGVAKEYQGSATNGTNIQHYSDVDLLLATERYITLKKPLVVSVPYKGEPTDDLWMTRLLSGSIVETRFPKVIIDYTKSKSLGLSGGSLKTPVDLVPCNWYETYEYYQDTTKNSYLRGIQVLDKDSKTREVNFPFLHNHRIGIKDLLTNGNARRLMRGIKSIKADLGDAGKTIKLSSYDIVGIVYNMPDEMLRLEYGGEVFLFERFVSFVRELSTKPLYANALEVPNGTRKLFSPSGASLLEATKLANEVEKVYAELGHSRLSGLRLDLAMKKLLALTERA